MGLGKVDAMSDKNAAGNEGQPKDPPANPPAMGNEGGDPQAILKEAQAELERTRQALKDANHEAATNRKKLREMEDKGKQANEKELQDQAKFKELAEVRQRELQELKDRMKESSYSTALVSEASKAGIIDHDLLKIVDKSKLIYNEADGSVVGASELIADLKKSKPHLFKQASAPANPPAPNPNFSKGGEPTLDDVANMSVAEQVAYHKKDRERRAKLSPFSKR